MCQDISNMAGRTPETVNDLIPLLCRRFWRCGHREGWAHVALQDSLQVVASEAQAGGQPVAGPPAAGKITASRRQRGILRLSGLGGHRHAYPGSMSHFEVLIECLNQVFSLQIHSEKLAQAPICK